MNHFTFEKHLRSASFSGLESIIATNFLQAGQAQDLGKSFVNYQSPKVSIEVVQTLMTKRMLSDVVSGRAPVSAALE